jgi:hypothetical protein
MKHFASTTMLVLCCLLALTSTAQQTAAPKPPLFAAYPDVIQCDVNEIARVFTIAQGQSANIALAGNFRFGGTVTVNELKYGTLQSAVIKSPFFNNAILHVSKRIKPDNSIVYTGRIINEAFADGYELKRDVAGNYQLIKIETERVIPSCNQQ